MKKINKNISTVLLFAVFLSSGIMYAQTQNANQKTSYRDRLVDFADIYTYKVNPTTKDTLRYVRTISEFWFGVFGGPNVNLSFGSLFSKTDPSNPNNVFFNKIVDFKSQMGYGYALGILGEWTRRNSDWGGGLKITAYDKKITRVGSDEVDIIYPQKFNFHTDLSYIIFTPFVKYSFPQFDGFYVSGGVDVAVIYNTKTWLESTFQNTGEIYHRYPLRDVNGKTRFMFSLGCGYDFFIADFFSANNRVRVTPFADFKFGTNIITDNGSNWNDVALNLGLQFKLSRDIVKIDTLIFDPESENRPVYFASIRNDIGVEFPRLTGVAMPPSINLAMIEVPADIAVVTPERETPPAVEVVATTTPEVRPRRRMNYNEMRRINFAGEASTTVTRTHRETLDDYVSFLKENPGAIIILTGHSDDRGTPAQNQARSQSRVDAVARYFVSQGIARNRIFPDARGSRYPIMENDTEQGRRANRRVDIVIQRGG